MSLWDYFRRSKASPKTGYALSDDDRQAAVEARRQKREIEMMRAEIEQLRVERQLEKERYELEQLRAELRGDDEEEEHNGSNIENILMMLAVKQLGGAGVPSGLNAGGDFPQPQPGVMPSSPSPPASLIHYSDEDIMNTLDKIPKAQRKLIDLMPEQLLRVKLREMFNADDDSINRAVTIIKS